MAKAKSGWFARLNVVVWFVVIVVLFTPLTEILYKPLIVDEPPQRGELIVIFSSGFFPDDLPDFATTVRLRRGVELYRNGIAPKILCLGGGWYSKEGLTLSQSMALELRKSYYIPPDDILALSETDHTYADISSMVAKYGDEFDFNKTNFVSSAYHTYRIKQILLKKGITGPVVAAAPYELYPRKAIERIYSFRKVSREYAAIVYSWLYGWLDIELDII
ncbi:MAG: YdcF family protein [Magnetococcales bacterium]|nr:YdcF family protein [Magnetococcales bacterium]